MHAARVQLCTRECGEHDQINMQQRVWKKLFGCTEYRFIVKSDNSSMINCHRGHMRTLDESILRQTGIWVEILEHIGQIIVVIVGLVNNIAFVLWQSAETISFVAFVIGEQIAHVHSFGDA